MPYSLVLRPGTAVPQPAIAILARPLGLTAYDLRPRIRAVTDGPAVLKTWADADACNAAAAQVADALGAAASVVLTPDDIGAEARTMAVRTFAFTAAGLRLAQRDGTDTTLPFADIGLALHGVRSATTVTTHSEIKSKGGSKALSLVVPGAHLVARRKVVEKTTVSEEKRTPFLRLYGPGPGYAPLADLTQDGLTYEGLGERLQPSRAANFAYLIRLIRHFAPHLDFDDRLLPRAGCKQILGPGLDVEADLLTATAAIRATRGP